MISGSSSKIWTRRALGAAAIGLLLLAGVAASRLLPEIPPAAYSTRAPDETSKRPPRLADASLATSADPAARSSTSPAAAAPSISGAEPGLSSTRSSAGILLFGALTIGAVVWWRRLHTAGARPAAALELLAQSSLGGRARALWLRAEERNLLVAVTPQAVQILDRWPRAAAPAPRRQELEADDDDDFDHHPTGDFAAPAPASLVRRISAAAQPHFTAVAAHAASDRPHRLAARTGRRAGRRHRRLSRGRARLGCARDQEPR